MKKGENKRKLVTIKGYNIYIRVGSKKYLVTYNGKCYERFVYIFKGNYMAIIDGQLRNVGLRLSNDFRKSIVQR